MRKKFLKILISLIILFSMSFSLKAQGDISPALFMWGINFLTTIDQFLIDIQNDTDDISSSPFEKRFKISTDIFWNLFSVGNISFKVRVINEGKWKEWVPGISIGISYWNFWGLYIVNSNVNDVDLNAQGFTLSTTFSKTFEEKIKLFTGFKYALNALKVELPREKLSIEGISLAPENRDEISNLFSIYAGINYLRLKKGELVVLVGYTFKYNKIFSSVQLVLKHFTCGVNIYPETGIPVHPFVRLDINF